MSVSAATLGKVQRARLSATAATHRPAPASVVVQASAPEFGRPGAAKWRVSVAVACSVLVHVWLLWRVDSGQVGPVTVAQSAPLAVRIKTIIAAPAPVQSAAAMTAPVPPEPVRSKPLVQTPPPQRAEPRKRQPEQPVQRQARPEPVPAVAEPVPTKRAPLSAAARTQAAVTSPAAAKAQTTTATADSEIPLITDPRYRRPPQPPAYPSQSVRRNEEGTALIRARISSLGDVLEVRVFESSGSALLDKSALAAVRRWLFVPASRSGQPSEAWVQVPVHFRLDE